MKDKARVLAQSIVATKALEADKTPAFGLVGPLIMQDNVMVTGLCDIYTGLIGVGYHDKIILQFIKPDLEFLTPENAAGITKSIDKLKAHPLFETTYDTEVFTNLIYTRPAEWAADIEHVKYIRFDEISQAYKDHLISNVPESHRAGYEKWLGEFIADWVQHAKDNPEKTEEARQRVVQHVEADEGSQEVLH